MRRGSSIKRSFLLVGLIPILYVCVYLLVHQLSFSETEDEPQLPISETIEESLPVTLSIEGDLGLYFYRQELSREKVVQFYSEKTGSREIASLILHYAEVEDIPLPLAFGLAWGESRYNPKAVNRNQSSIDRGLFQLNSRSFPKMGEEQFFNPEINAATGLKYLRYCLNVGGNEVVALAMYNAGRTRVTSKGAPKMTLDYISKILRYADTVADEFEYEMDLTKLISFDGQKELASFSYVLKAKSSP